MPIVFATCNVILPYSLSPPFSIVTIDLESPEVINYRILRVLMDVSRFNYMLTLNGGVVAHERQQLIF